MKIANTNIDKPKYMNKVQLAKEFGMSKRGVEEALTQSLLQG